MLIKENGKEFPFPDNAGFTMNLEIYAFRDFTFTP